MKSVHTMLRVSVVIMGLTICVAGVSGDEKSPALRALVETERAFARASVERGVRDAFIRFFADDGISFQPHPVNTREWFGKQPAERAPITLDWEPVFGDISASADLGYTTGPWVLKDNGPQKRPPRYGYYFSVWKKQPTGEWRVAVDIGISTPPPSEPLVRGAFRAARLAGPGDRRHSSAAGERNSLLEAEKRLERMSSDMGVAPAYASLLAEESRIHRPNLSPILGRAAALFILEKGPRILSWKPIGADVALAGDLGYVYGSYEYAQPDVRGYYLHVWKRNSTADWRLVADITNPLPGENK